MDESLRCPKCRSRKTRWQGYCMTQKDGRKHRRFCTACARTFYPKVKRPPGALQRDIVAEEYSKTDFKQQPDLG